MSVLIRPIPAIRPYLVALVIGVVLAIVGIPTRLSRLRRMTTATHECVGNFDMAKKELRTKLLVDRLLSETATWREYMPFTFLPGV